MTSQFSFPLFTFALTLPLLACSQSPDEPTGTAQSRLAAGSAVSGFNHSVSQSKFHLGLAAHLVSEHGLDRTVGTHGAAAVEANGSFRAISNADSPALARPRFPGEGKDHDARVLSYFIHSGLPSDQVKGVGTGSYLQGGGPANVPPQGQDVGTLVAHYSTVQRSVGGIPVVGSFAWARFNVDDEVVSEHVYWPPLPSAVVADAKKMQADVADRGLVAVLAGHGVTDGNNPRVVIVHSAATWNGAFFASASVDFERAGNKHTTHIGPAGSEFRLPHEDVAPATKEAKP